MYRRLQNVSLVLVSPSPLPEVTVGVLESSPRDRYKGLWQIQITGC